MAVKKQWYDIMAPKAFDERVVGETLSGDPKTLNGRTIHVSLLEISRDFAKFYIKLAFRIDRVEGNKAYTKFVGHDCLRERIYRMVQRRSRRVDVVQDAKTTDGYTLRVKTIFVILRRANTSVKNAARDRAREVIGKIVAEKTLNDMIGMIISGELAAIVKKECHVISPVGNVEIRKSEVLAEPAVVAA